LDIVSLAFASLLLTAVLLGGMLFFSVAFAPLVFMKLPGETAGRFIRHVFPVDYSSGAAVALVAALVSFWSLPGLVMALVGMAFLGARFWLMPEINRQRDLGVAGDAAAMAGFERLHDASVALNALQIFGVLAAFALIAQGWR
jgi:hypothetical protein